MSLIHDIYDTVRTNGADVIFDDDQSGTATIRNLLVKAEWQQEEATLRFSRREEAGTVHVRAEKWLSQTGWAEVWSSSARLNEDARGIIDTALMKTVFEATYKFLGFPYTTVR